MQITANKSFRYGGKAIAVGETFEAKNKDARLLIAVKKASAAKVAKPKQAKVETPVTQQKGQYETRVMTPKKAD